MAALAANTDWEEIDFEGSDLQNEIIRNAKEAGRQFTAFLKNGAKMVIGTIKLLIDRTTPFDPAKFIGAGWSIWKGPVDGEGLEGDEDQDQRSLALSEIDLSKVQLEHCLQEGEKSVTGEERLKRYIAKGHIRLHAKFFQYLWENQRLIPEEWKKYDAIYFFGTILRASSGRRYVLFLFWCGGQWGWRCDGLDRHSGASRPSVELAN